MCPSGTRSSFDPVKYSDFDPLEVSEVSLTSTFGLIRGNELVGLQKGIFGVRKAVSLSKMGANSNIGVKKSALKIKRRRNIYEVTEKRSKSWKSSRQLISAEHYDMLPPTACTYVSIDAGPSTFPTKKYCDFTGLPAKYTDPVTKMRFVSKEAFRVARKLPEHRVDNFLALRNAQVRIK